MGDYVRWSPPFYEGAEQGANSALFLALNRGNAIRSASTSRATRAARSCCVSSATPTCCSSPSGPRARPSRRGLRAAAGGEPAARVLRHHGLRPGRALARPQRPRHELPGARRPARAPGDRGGPPVQAAGQIADIGGGALMAAFGILAALRERDRSVEGQFVDVSMADGSLAWMAMVAARYLCDGGDAPARRPRAGGARWSATGPTSAPTGG